MQVNHQPVNEGSAGEEVTIKVDQKVHEGALLMKI